VYGRGAYRVLVGKPEDKGTLGNLGVDGQIILKWILTKQDGKVLTGFIWVTIGTKWGLP
jgi:hypothetical protein